MSSSSPVVIIGGGVAGLVAATILARAGVSVVVLERSSSLGGRAATRERHGFRFNFGPHALYSQGELRRTLTTLGVEVRGGVPSGNGGFAICAGRPYTLPVGFTSLLTTGLLSLAGKLSFTRLLKAVPGMDVQALRHQTLEDWVGAIDDERVRQLILMLTRVTTLTNDPSRHSAGAALAQVQLSLGSVLYVDSGWQTIVDGLSHAARAMGVVIQSGASVVSLEPRFGRSDSRRGEVDAVRLADGTVIRAAAVIIAAGPAEVDALTASTRFSSELPAPVRVASLDLGLTSLPQPRRLMALGVDTPVYFSVHSAVAGLAPPGAALIHACKYLAPDESSGSQVEHELEALVDTIQPGWRRRLVVRRYLPKLIVTQTELVASRGGISGRPGIRVDAFDNVFIAGDWVGPRGQLSDAAAASAAAAAATVVERLRRPSAELIEAAS